MKDWNGTAARLIILGAIATLVVTSAAAGAVPPLMTPGEQSHYSEYSQHEAIARFLGRVAALAPEAKVRVIGRTREVREYPSQELYLCVLSEEGIARPDQRTADKPTVLIIGSQHGNEQSAKEAALKLIRDFSLGDLKPLLKKINVLIIPQANPYGNFFDRRTNEQDLDLNRDHAKLEAEETIAIHRVFAEWQPEVTIDAHEKGDDYYRVSIGCVSNANIDPRLQDYSRATLLAAVEASLAKAGVTFHEYLVTEEMGINTASGAAIRPEDLKERQVMTRYSTSDINDGRNSLGIYNTLSFIQECSSRHDLKTLAERTGWQAAGLRGMLEAVVSRATEVKGLVHEARQALREAALARGAAHPVTLKMDYARDPKQPQLVLKRFANSDSPIVGVLKSDKKAGDTVSEGDLADYPWPARVKVVTETVKNWFPLVEPKLSVERPRGYILPAGLTAVVETLVRHGLEVGIFTGEVSLEEEVYKVEDVVPSKYDYLPPEVLKVTPQAQTTLIRQGDFYVSCDQPGANLIPCLLEPQSDFGLISYQALKLVPEKGSFYAIGRFNGETALPLAPYKRFLR